MDIKHPSVNTIITSILEPRELPQFTFVTITNPNDIKDAKRQTKIRRHARESTIRAKQQRRRHPRKMVFDLPESKPQNDNNAVLIRPTTIIHKDMISSLKGTEVRTEEHEESTSLSLTFLRPMGHGKGLNPLAPFPAVANARIRDILNYVLSSRNKAYGPLVEVWITTSMSDESAFQITVANAAMIYGADAVHKPSETAESMNYYSMSLQSVNKRLQDPMDGISEGVIGTVIGFACHDHLVGNYQRVNVHLNGLEKIIEMRGGIDTLRACHVIRLMVFRIDVSDSLVMDTPPRFPLPSELVYRFINEHHFGILNGIIETLGADFPHMADIVQVLPQMAKMAQYINDLIGSMETSLWQDEWFMVRRFQPVLYQVLSLPRLQVRQLNLVPGAVIREAVRLACLIFLGSVNSRFYVSLGGVVPYKAEMMKLLARYAVPWPSLLALRLWVLVIGGMLTEEEVRVWHVREISQTMHQLGLEGWMDAYAVIKETLWVNGTLDDEAERLGIEVEEYIGQQ